MKKSRSFYLHPECNQGGDSISGLRLKDGKVTKHEVGYVLK